MIPGKDYEKLVVEATRKLWEYGITRTSAERAYKDMQSVMDYIEGHGHIPERSKAISLVYDNRIRRVLTDVTSAFTDVRPIWDYKTFDPAYEPQAAILSKLARSWWRNSHSDRRLQSAITYAFSGGSGYVLVQWNPFLPGGGDIELVPVDPRDVAPIGGVPGESIQEWQGAIVRESVSVAELKARYPEKAHLLNGVKDKWKNTSVPKSKQEVWTPAWKMLFKPSATIRTEADVTDVYRVYVKDYSLNTGDKPVLMGMPGSSWQYEVPPVGYVYPPDHKKAGQKASMDDARLYPRGRVVIVTPDCVLDDQPNPYWHGLIPLVRFTLVPLPWTFLGASIGADLIPLNNDLNEGLRGLSDGMGQWIRRGVIADKNAMPKTELDAIDTRRSGMKMRVNATMGEGIKVVDGPVFPDWYMDYIRYNREEIDDISGVRGLQQLASLKQMPSSDTLEKFQDAMSPTLRQMADGVEIGLSEIAYMFMVNVFQYYTLGRRMQILGPKGATLEDFDYDPDKLVPAMKPGEANYKPQYDVNTTTRQERASHHWRNFTFAVAPNSFLEVSHMGRRMLVLQATRMNLMDPWTFWESLDINNVGAPPADTVPERMIEARKMGLQPGPTPELVQMQEQLAKMQMTVQMMLLGQQGAMMQAGIPPQGGPQGGPPGAPPGGPGGGGPPGIPEAPSTTGTGPQGGRPPSGNKPPELVMKDGGSRMAVSESGR